VLTVFWYPLGFSLVEILQKEIHSDSQYFCSNILSAIVQNGQSETPEDRRRRMVVHSDNATPHPVKCTIEYLSATRLTRATHPASSPDLALSDFYLFDKPKRVLMGAAFPDDELLQGLMEVLSGISREDLEVVFEEWILGLNRCIRQNGEYLEYGEFNGHVLIISALSCVPMLKISRTPYKWALLWRNTNISYAFVYLIRNRY
jgi:hypothetical protein